MKHRKLIVAVILLLPVFAASAQQDKSVPDFSKDSVITDGGVITPREKAARILLTLKDGTVIVCLRTDKKSIDAYRNAGKEGVANRLEKKRRKVNLKLYSAFISEFDFCRVYFIYAYDIQNMLQGKKVFLNSELKPDTSISLLSPNFVFCELGSAIPFSDFLDYPGSISIGTSKPQKIPDSSTGGTTTSPATSNDLVFFDQDFKQLERPFPYVEAVYFGSFYSSVAELNRELTKVYDRMVLDRSLEKSK